MQIELLRCHLIQQGLSEFVAYAESEGALIARDRGWLKPARSTSLEPLVQVLPEG